MIGFPRVHYQSTDSTNSRALDLAKRGAPSGTIVTADYQTGGRGRQGREWIAPPGSSLLLSVIVREPPELLALRAGLAVAESIKLVTQEIPTLKWPNDVLLGDGKVSGVLVQARPQERVAVVGIGVNTAIDLVNLPPEVAKSAATLSLRSNETSSLLTQLKTTLERQLVTSDETVIAAFNELDALYGKSIAWEDATGVASGITVDGHLRVRLSADEETQLSAGEVHLLQ